MLSYLLKALYFLVKDVRVMAVGTGNFASGMEGKGRRVFK